MVLRQGFSRGCLHAGLVLWIAGALALSCSGKSDDGDADDAEDCVSLCESAQACPNAEQVDCGASCREAAELAESSGCTAELEDLLSCIADLPDGCDLPAGGCDPKLDTLSMCLNA